PLAPPGRHDVLPVYPDRRRAGKALKPGLLVVADLDPLDLRLHALLAENPLEAGERLRVRRATVPPQELNRHAAPCGRSWRPRRGDRPGPSRAPRSRPPRPCLSER